jgi:hypothetical protein
MALNDLIGNIINVIGTTPTKVESDLFINEFLMGQTAQEYVVQGLALREKVNRDFVHE